MPEVTEVTLEKSWWGPFFDALAETGIVTTSCKRARITRKTVYQYRRTVPEFAERWKEAEKQGVGVLADVATQRAIKHSDTLLIFLLKCRDRETYGDRIETKGTLQINGTFNLDHLSDAELDREIAETEGRETP